MNIGVNTTAVASLVINADKTPDSNKKKDQF